MKKYSKSKKSVQQVLSGVVHISATFNNTLITVTDSHGDTVAWSSAGVNGFKGSKKSTPYAAQVTASDVAKKAMDVGIRFLVAEVKGPGSGREAALRSIAASGINITTIKDVTPIPHNGCRPSKRRKP